MGFVQRVAFLREVVIHRGSSWNYSGSFSSVLGVRVGEAKNPGPMHAKVWSLQVRNIVSAAAHLDEIALGEDQCVVWTETSATQSTLQSLKLLSKTHATSLVHSAPAATRTVRGKTALGRGEASGTLIWSSCKARDLKELWPQTAFQTGRVADAFISVGAVQVRVIACYGFPSSIPNHLGLNELLFQEVFFQANAYEVPTLIVGDLNVNLQNMQCWEKYSALGFCDYGAHVAALGGLSPQPTYRGISRLDYCIANSWAMPYLAGFSVDPRGFTDHGSLHILLGIEAHQPVCTRWAMPFDIAPVPGYATAGGCSALVSKVRGHTVTLADTLKSEMIVSTVTQATWSARPSYVAEQIRQYWCQFWFSKKTPDLDFVKAHLDLLPHLPPFDPVISAAELHWAARNLKMGKARGLDGFSNAELKSLSPDLFSMLLSLLNHLTSSVTWPANLCQASMAFLAKTLQPDKPADGRPITILSTLYRLWSKIVARKMMLHLLPVLPPSLTGSVPGKSSVSLAFELQSSIEAALLEDASQSGVTMDLSKAYNLINRDVLLLISERLGWPSSVQQSYFAFLKNLRRFITVDKDMSVSSYSDVGVPEGDPIAVTAMIILTFFVSVKLQNDCQTPLSSYVDNWAVQSSSPSEVLSGVDSVAGSVAAIAMSLAVDKLKFYATSADARKQRGSTCLGQPCCVVHDFQDFGVFFCAARRQTAKCFGTRFQQCQTRFQKLVVAPWADGVKCHSLLRTIVPAVLYGCELTHYSKSSLRMIRGRFSSSLWGQRSRRDHFLAPLLAGAVVYEPFLLILGRRWQAMQRASCQNQDTFRRWWNTAASADESSLLGPFTYFFEQLRQIGWIVEADGFVSDHDGVLWSISWNSWNTVQTLAYTAWVRVITPLVREDEQFSGLQPFQLEQIRSAFSDKKQYNTVLGNYATGAIISSAAKEHYMTSEDACCSLCGSSSGGAVHLLYECPCTKEFRTEAQQLLVALPNAVRVANLVPASIHVGSFRRALAAQSIGSLYTFAEPVHLFTDGSTQHPNDPAVSLSAWSVVLAEQGSVDKTLVHADVLPGVIQSNNRAELFAVVQATLTAPGGHIYSDSQYVVHGWNKLVARGWMRQEWASCSHSDLWYDLYLSLRASVNGWEIHKVTSHLDVASAVSLEQAWCIIHNAFADECAKRANAARPADILQMHASLCRHRQVQAWRLKHTSELQLLCSDRAKKACKQSSFENAGGKDDIWILHLERFGMMQHDRTFSIPSADMAFNSFGFLMHKPYGMLLWSWLARQRWVEDAEGMSAAELYTLVCLQTGWVSPRNITRIPESERPPGLRTGLSASARVWTHELAWPALALTRESFSAQISTFRVVMAALFKQQGISWSFQPATSLLLFQHPLVTSSLFVRPVSSLDGSAIQYMQRLRRGSSWCSFLARGFTVPTVPLQAPCAEPDVAAVFREWKASSR